MSNSLIYRESVELLCVNAFNVIYKALNLLIVLHGETL